MPQYIIHIGPPKTATKYLQSSFYRLRQELKKDGVYYPDGWWKVPAQFSHQELVSELAAGVPGELEPRFEGFNSSDYATILFSCEGFVGLKSAQLERLRQLIAGAPTKIVYYFRRFTDWLPSSWQEMVGQGSTELFPETMAKLLRAPIHEQAINVTLILDRFAELFGKDSIVLGSYSNVMDRKGDILQDFLRNVLHLTYDTQGLTRKFNASPNPLTTELVRALNALNGSGRAPRLRFDRALALLDGNREAQEDLTFIYKHMEQCLNTIKLSDNCAALLPMHQLLREKYGRHLIGLEHGHDVCESKERHIPYVSPDYLLANGVSEAVRRIYGAIENTAT